MKFVLTLAYAAFVLGRIVEAAASADDYKHAMFEKYESTTHAHFQGTVIQKVGLIPTGQE